MELIPEEIIHDICLFLLLPDIGRLLIINKYFYKILKDNYFWHQKYIIYYKYDINYINDWRNFRCIQHLEFPHLMF